MGSALAVCNLCSATGTMCCGREDPGKILCFFPSLCLHKTKCGSYLGACGMLGNMSIHFPALSPIESFLPPFPPILPSPEPLLTPNSHVFSSTSCQFSSLHCIWQGPPSPPSSPLLPLVSSHQGFYVQACVSLHFPCLSLRAFFLCITTWLSLETPCLSLFPLGAIGDEGCSLSPHYMPPQSFSFHLLHALRISPPLSYPRAWIHHPDCGISCSHTDLRVPLSPSGVQGFSPLVKGPWIPVVLMSKKAKQKAAVVCGISGMWVWGLAGVMDE